MTWKLWIDDQAYDQDTPSRWAPDGFVVAVNSDQAIRLIKQFGPPEFIDFDHDLGYVFGECDDARIVCKFLADNYFEAETIIKWNVHSANPVGRDWINSYMNSWQKYQ